MVKKWKLWTKQQSNFKIRKYILIVEYSNGLEIVLINKKAFIDAVNNNIEVFQNILKQKIKPIDLLNDIEKGKISFRSITNNDYLLGILLGYGKHNAMLYCQRRKLFKSDF